MDKAPRKSGGKVLRSLGAVPAAPRVSAFAVINSEKKAADALAGVIPGIRTEWLGRPRRLSLRFPTLDRGERPRGHAVA